MSRRSLILPEPDRQPPPIEEDDGPYVGIERYANVLPTIANLCAMPEGGVDVAAMLSFKHGPADLDDLLDAFEIDAVARSWRAARIANRKAAQDA